MKYFALLIVIVVVFLFYMGAFTKVAFTEDYSDTYRIVYVEHIGPYKETGKAMDDLYQELQKDEINPTKGIGIYYDNPKKVDKEKLRSEVGSIIEKEDYGKLIDLDEKYKTKNVDLGKSVITELPYKNKLSIFIGLTKVYPKLEKYAEENNLRLEEAMEIYDLEKGTITYISKIAE